jgi:oligopeptide transport system substrate-binding protein
VRWRRCAALLAVVATMAVACTSKPRSEGKPVFGGTLKVNIRDLGSLDPARATGPGAQLIVSQVFDSLTAIDPATKQVVPAAASSWKTSNNGLTWTFRIARRTFQNGQRVRASDFKFEFDRLTRKKFKSELAILLEPVHGFHATNVAGSTSSLAGVSAPSSDLLVIKLDKPFYELPYNLSHPGLAPVSAKAYRSSTRGLATHPIGNGPFRVKSAKAESNASLVRYDKYGGQKAYLNGVDFTVVSNTDDAFRSYLDGKSDITDVPINQIAGGRGFDQRGFTPVWAESYYGPNLRLAKYGNSRVRRAISMAIDREAIAKIVYANTRDVATGLLPRDVRGYIPDACHVCELDREAAHNTLKAIFKKKFPSITIDYLADATDKAVAKEIANDLERVGFKTSLRAHGASEYRKFLNKHEQDFAQLGWVSDVPSPEGFLAQQLLTGSVNNPTGFNDGVFNAAISRARREKNESKRLADYASAEKRALDRMPLIPIVFFRNREAVASRVHGFVLDGAGLFDASKIWLKG